MVKSAKFSPSIPILLKFTFLYQTPLMEAFSITAYVKEEEAVVRFTHICFFKFVEIPFCEAFIFRKSDVRWLHVANLMLLLLFYACMCGI